jgi:DNA-binding response OmpR family regulator
MSLPIPKTILLVEDEPLLLNFVRTLLRRAGYSVLSAATPEAAIRIERERTESIDLLLTGFSLPRLSGPELAEQLKWRRPQLRVMLMSSDPAAHALARDNDWSFTGKPFAISSFLGKIENLLAPNVEMSIGEIRQSRLDASCAFAKPFRAAAVQPDARSRGSWRLHWNRPLVSWTGAAVAVLASLLLVVGTIRKPPTAPAMVFLQSLRGPDAPAQVTAGRPALLVFDIVPPAGVNDYEARIVSPVGIEILAAPVFAKDGRLAVLVHRLPPGSYWVRVFRTGNREPIVEYGLRAR